MKPIFERRFIRDRRFLLRKSLPDEIFWEKEAEEMRKAGNAWKLWDGIASAMDGIPVARPLATSYISPQRFHISREGHFGHDRA
jgi:hypothetical protein